MKRFYGLVAMGLILGLTSGASAHIGEQIFLLFEIADEDIGDLDFTDGTVEDWEDVVGDPQLVTTDFYQHPDVGDGAQYDPEDLDYRIWLGWNGNLGTIWFAIERTDNVYFGREYSGRSPWNYEATELMLDGDHSGGDYTGSANQDWTAEEQKLNNNRTAQQHFAVADAPSGRHVFYFGAGSEWVDDVPYADGGGVSIGDGPTVSIIEFFCTPFDDLIWNSPDDSVPSPLFEDKVIGLQITIPDTDQAPGTDRAFHTLSGQAATWRFADRFVDARLVSAVGGTDDTAVEDEQEGTGDTAVEDEQEGTGDTAVEDEQAITQTLTKVSKVSGDGQGGIVGEQLATPFVVSVLDQNGSAIAEAVVTFAVTAGGGTLSAASATTNANGRARSTLTLGSEPGLNTVSATVAGLEPVTFTASGYLTPRSLTKVSGDGQEGPASTQLAEPFVVSVLDEDGAAIAGVAVRFLVATGEGMLSSTTDANPCIFKRFTSSTTATTDANGHATARLTLGSEPGTNTVSATVAGLEPVTFTATAAEQVTPHSLTKVCGEDQEGTAGERLAQPLVVSVLDEDGAAMAGVTVSFAVTAGGGKLLSAMATTNANGHARTWLTLGSEPGANTVSATVEGLESVIFTATGQERPISLFDIFLGSGKLVALPDRPQLAQNAPNPFNSQTVLSYFLHAPSPARLEVFSLTGQRVAVLHQGPQQAGYHRLHWDARDDAGRSVASGMYLYRLVTNEGVLTRKLILLR